MSIVRFFWRGSPVCGDLFYALRKNSGQLGEILDGADHLAGVAVLVVVPGHDLHLIGVVVDLGNHGLGGIKQRGRKPARTLKEYKYENQRLKMENELLRDFITLMGRK